MYDISPWPFFVFVFTSRRKLKADVSSAFPSLSAGEVSELVPSKEEVNVVKIYAHKGDTVTLYVLHKNPLFFELDKRLYPTGDSQALKLYLLIDKVVSACLKNLLTLCWRIFQFICFGATLRPCQHSVLGLLCFRSWLEALVSSFSVQMFK